MRRFFITMKRKFGRLKHVWVMNCKDESEAREKAVKRHPKHKILTVEPYDVHITGLVRWEMIL